MLASLPDELLKLPHRCDIPFSQLTTLGVGGTCRWLFEPVTEQQAQVFVRACVKEGLAYRVLGGGSNLLVLGDIQAPVLRLRLPAQAVREGRQLTAPANHGHTALAGAAAAEGLSGLEWAEGIPGSLGGAVRMNAGAHGDEWVNVLSRYRFLTPDGELVDKVPEPGEFKYRWSWLTAGQLILSATAELTEGDPLQIRAVMAAHRAKRTASQPKGKRSAGCIFKNPKGDSAGRLIESAGLKGQRIGEAEVSSVHANFLLNLGAATPVDFKALMDLVREKVRETSGVELETEVQIWSE
jgi:UDP-N-acetylmuramate dehydrogenase